MIGINLRVLQWNFDHLLAKVPELVICLKKGKYMGLLQDCNYVLRMVQRDDVVLKDRCRNGVTGSGHWLWLVCKIRKSLRYREIKVFNR